MDLRQLVSWPLSDRPLGGITLKVMDRIGIGTRNGKGREQVKPITAQVVTRTFDRVSIAYVPGADNQQHEAGRIYVRDELDYGYWYVFGLVVYPQYRGKGIARALMEEVIETYGYDRLELIHAATGDGMTTEQLRDWYVRLGFEVGPSANQKRGPRVSDTRRMARPGIRGI